MRNLLPELNKPWAMDPRRFTEMQDVYISHLRGEKINIATVEAALGRQLDNQVKRYTVENGVATIYLEGILGKRLSAFQQISGGTSTQLAMNDFRSALADPDVKAIILYIDSPGGSVDGTQELAQAIYAARGKKPITTFSDGMMASAAYWIGASADRIYISGDTVAVGSVGVVARHIDYSKAEEQIGVKTTEIYAGRFKSIASQYAPLSESGRRSIQDMVDHVYSAFVHDVAGFRNLNPEPISQGTLESIPWADGRIFLGQQAVKAGLVDGFSTMAEIIFSKGMLPASKRQPSKLSISIDETKLPLEKRAALQWQRDPKLRGEFRMSGLAGYIGWLKHEERAKK